jgi:hypothetical protein
MPWTSPGATGAVPCTPLPAFGDVSGYAANTEPFSSSDSSLSASLLAWPESKPLHHRDNCVDAAYAMSDCSDGVAAWPELDTDVETDTCTGATSRELAQQLPVENFRGNMAASAASDGSCDAPARMKMSFLLCSEQKTCVVDESER